MKRLVIALVLLFPALAVAATIHVPADQPTIAEEATLGFPKIVLSDTSSSYALYPYQIAPDEFPCKTTDTIWVWNTGTSDLQVLLKEDHLPQNTYTDFDPLGWSRDTAVIPPGDSAAVFIFGCYDNIAGNEFHGRCAYSVPGEFQGFLKLISNDPLDSATSINITRSIPDPMLPGITVAELSPSDVFYTQQSNYIFYLTHTFCGTNRAVDLIVSYDSARTWSMGPEANDPITDMGFFNLNPTVQSDSCILIVTVTDWLGRIASDTAYVKVRRQYNGPVWYVSPGGDDETGIGSESQPFRTLQFGITVADPGDTVVAGSGAYSPVVIDKPLTLLGSDGATSTEIVGLPDTRCVLINTAADTVIVDGFTLRNGLPSSNSVFPYGQGGGLLSIGSNVRIANCVVTGNGSYSSGGGLAFRDSSYFEIVNTRICANSASQSGGGIVAIDAKGCKISNTIIDSNEASLNGGGVFVYSSSVNPAMSFELRNCVIAGNTAHEYGMGIGVRRNSVSLSNCIVYANHAAIGATAPSGVYVSAGSLSLNCSDLYMNDQADLFTENVSDSSGNISLDPRFCGAAAGDFHISRCSPCAPGNSGCGELIGRYGAGCSSGCPPSSLTWHVAVDGSDLTGDASAANPLATIQFGMDLARNGDTVLVAPGTYRGTGNKNMSTLGKAIIVRGTAGSDSTVLSCEGDSSAFAMISTNEDSATVIEGFTITGAVNGMAIDGAAPKIKNVVFANNEENGLTVGSGSGSLSTAVVENCLFMENNGCGIVSIGSLGLRVGSCDFSNNGRAGVSHDGHAELRFSNCGFVRNPIGITSARRTTVSIDSCSFDFNQTALDGGFFVKDSRFTGGDKGLQGGGGAYNVPEYHCTGCLFEQITGAVAEATSGFTEFTNCTIRGNPGTIAYSSGGYREYPYGLVFTNCEILGNGGGMEVSHCTVLSLTQCTYVSNGGGIIFSTEPYFSRPLRIIACTIADNLSDGVTIERLGAEAVHLVKNTVIANNGGIGFSCSDPNLNMLTFTCNDVYGNLQGNYSVIPDQTDSNGNISLDPQFCDAANGNFQVRQSSPCAPNNNGCGVLIGALGVGCQSGDNDGDGSITIADAVFLINYIFIGGPAPEPLSIGDSDCSGDVNIADAVIIINYIFSGGPAPCAI